MLSGSGIKKVLSATWTASYIMATGLAWRQGFGIAPINNKSTYS